MKFGNSPSRGDITHTAQHLYDTEDGKKIVIAMDLPGYTKDDIQARYDNDYIVIRAGSASHPRREFEQRIDMPPGAEVKETQATFKNGVLTLTVPITEGKQSDLH